MSEGRFLTGSTMGHVVRMTATGAFGITFVFLVDAANLVWIAQLGDPRLVAAIGFAFAIQFFSVSSGVGLMIASTAMVSRSIGEGNREKARAQAGAAMVTAAVIQAVVATLVIVLRHDLLALAGATGETAAMAARYLLITMPSLVLMAIGLIASGVLRAEGLGAKAMYITLLSGALLMVIDPVLIIGLGWGLDGAAIGLLLFRVALMLLGLYFAAWQNKLIARPDLTALRTVLPVYLAIAVPAIATQMATPVGNYLLTMIMAPFGDDAVAAWAVVGRLTVVVFGGIFALSGAIGGIFGQNYGAGYYARLRSTYRDALIFCLMYTLTMWLALFWATPYVSALFGLTGQGADVLRAFSIVGVGGFIFVGPLFVCNAAFNSLGKPARSTLLNWSKEAAIGWPAAALLAIYFGASGVIYGQALASMLVGTLACFWGWRYVAGLEGARKRALDVAALRPYPNPDRYRRR
ncbi:MATE family efflux transporter [Roseobacter litoralis]|uniref:MATE family efflux transporter n=1 Tax=Roseobacter litoralis TaxID=42443 RepID=UPI00248F952B|nr:MATE family efflux transporter [Roseobacter litoralis]